MAKSLATSWRSSLMMLTTGGMRPFQTQRQGDMFTEIPTSFPLKRISRSESFRWRSSHLMWRGTDRTASPRSSTIQEMVRFWFFVGFQFWILQFPLKHKVWDTFLSFPIHFVWLSSTYRVSDRRLRQAGVLHRSSGLVVASGRHWYRPAAVHRGIPGTELFWTSSLRFTQRQTSLSLSRGLLHFEEFIHSELNACVASQNFWKVLNEWVLYKA